MPNTDEWILVDREPEPSAEWSIDLRSRSVIAGSPLFMRANHPLRGVSLQVVKVEEREDSWTLSAGVEVDTEQPTTGHCRAIGDLPSGLYMLIRLDLREETRRGPSHVRIHPPLFFEVRAASEQPRTTAQLQAAYEDVVRRRQEMRLSGIGQGPVVAEVLVFVKDLLTTVRLDLVGCEVVPLQPVGWSAEVRAVDRFLESTVGQPLPWPRELLDHVGRAEPATLIAFPVVRAASTDECGQLALREASLIVSLLASHRGSYGEIFCTLVHQPEIGVLLPGLHIPRYAGNLVGGMLAGEEPEGLRRDLHAVRNDSTLQFFVVLLGEALRERRPDFQYVRLWSLLETIAKSRGCEGRPQRNWDGQIRLRNNGQAALVKHAADLVYELMRELLAPRGISEQTFTGGLGYGHLRQQTSVWYRRRNCVAHGDPQCACLHSSPAQQATQAYVDCLTARGDDQGGYDPYLANLREVTKAVVTSTLRERWPPA